ADPVRRAVVDAGELDVGELAGEALEVAAEDEADADHELDLARREDAQRGFAVGALGRLDVLGFDVEVLARGLEPAPRRLVERLAVLAADVEHEPDAEAGLLDSLAGAHRERAHAEQDDVRRGQESDHARWSHARLVARRAPLAQVTTSRSVRCTEVVGP